MSNQDKIKPFWAPSTLSLSQQLWSSSEPICMDLDDNWSLGSSLKLVQNSWFTVKQTLQQQQHPVNNNNISSSLWDAMLKDIQGKTDIVETERIKKHEMSIQRQRMRVQASQKAALERKRKKETDTSARKKVKLDSKSELVTEEREDNPPPPPFPLVVTKPPAERMIRYRLHPTKQQKLLLVKALGVVRWTYNICNSAVKNNECKASMTQLRSHALNSNAPFLSDKPWVLEVPYDIRDEAAKDLMQAYSTNSKKKDKTGKPFNAKYRSKFSKTQTIKILAKHYKGPGIFHPGFFGKLPFRSSERLPAKLQYDATLLRDWVGRYYLLVPRPLVKRESVHTRRNIASIDPGVRTFMTLYDTQGCCIEWGKQDIQRIHRLNHHMDKLKGKIAKKKAKKLKMKLALRRMYLRVQNLIKDFHHKCSKWLCQNYQVILLPHFKAQQMASKKTKRKIGKSTVRNMLGWCHATFRERLKEKAREFPGCRVVMVDEAYTSKTCGMCGMLHPNLGSSKHFKCPSCSFQWDRDFNAARNVLLRYITLNHGDEIDRPEPDFILAEEHIRWMDAQMEAHPISTTTTSKKSD
jgi:putative transposase